MAFDLGPNLTPEATKLHSTGAWIWLFDVPVGTSEIVYLAAHDANVSWNSRTYYAFPLMEPQIPEASGTQAPTISLTVHQIDESLTNRLRDGELQGQTVVMRLVHSDHLSDSTYYVERSADILTADVQRDRIVFTLGTANWLTRTLGRRFLRLRCRHVYGGAVCGYDTGRTGAIADCDHTLNGANGCVVHGQDEKDAGLYASHPGRFGGEPSLPRQNRG